MSDTVVIEGRGGILPRLRLLRLPNAVTAVADIIAGGALAGVAPGRLLPLALAASLVYAGGCALNDLADRGIDVDKHPRRPLPAGDVSPKEAGFLAITLLVAGVGAAAVAGPVSALAAAFLVSLVLLYDLAAKTHPLTGPLTMGGCRAAAVVLGMTPAFPPPPAALFFPAAALLYVFALSLLARCETPAPCGRPPAAGIALSVLGAIGLLVAGGAALPGFHPARGAVFFPLFLGGAGAGLWRALAGRDVAAGVGRMILAIPLLGAVGAAGAGSWGEGVAAACCALPAWMARRRFYIT